MALLLLIGAVAGCGRMWPGNFPGTNALVQPTATPGPSGTLSVLNGEFIAGSSEQATVSVTLVDASGNPMVGVSPTLNISGMGNVQSCGSTSPVGTAQCTITSTTAGIKTVTVSAPQVNSNSVNVTGLPGETFRYIWNAQPDATLPLVNGRSYNFTVYWGDGTSSEITSAVDSDKTHTYTSPGLKTITLSGAFDQLQFAIHPERLMDVTRWGTTQWYSMSAMFKDAVNLSSFSATDVPDTSAVGDFSEMFMRAVTFNGDVTQWNTISATHMQRMFKGAVAFNQDISELPGNIWDVSGVLNFSEMFSADISDFTVLFTPAYTPMIFNQNISNWGMNSAGNTSKMFAGCESFNQNLSGWLTMNVTDMSFMFMHAKSFNSDLVPVGNVWNVSNVTNFEGMFQGATDFNGNIAGWNTSSATTLRRMFAQASVFNQDIRNWNTSSVQSLYETFYGAAQFDQQIGVWNTASNRSLYRTFAFATAFARSLNNWNTSAVTNMAGTFLGATNFNNGGDPFNWNTSSVTTTSNMFGGASAFNQPMVSVGGVWNFANVTVMEEMFQNATAFNQDISSWNTSKVTNMIRMFKGATAFNQNLGTWDTSKVTSMREMFSGATAFNGSVGSWDTSQVISFYGMFLRASSFNQDLTLWNVGAATTMFSMFQDAVSFNQNEPCGVNGAMKALIWNTTLVTNVAKMFENADCFNQGINLDTAALTDMSEMFRSTDHFNQSLAGWDVSQVLDLHGIFEMTQVFDQDLSSWSPVSVVNLKSAFARALAFNNSGVPLNWVTPLATDMSYMFQGAVALTVPIQLSTNSVLDMKYMFHGASSFNQGLTPSGAIWNTSSVRDMTFMFFNATVFDQDISMWNVSSVTDARAFHGGTNEVGWINSERPFFPAGTASRRMFVTSTIQNGNLGGVPGADATCHLDANKPPTGTYKAYVGTAGMRTLSPVEMDWPLAASMKYTRPDGTLITTTDASKRFSLAALSSPVSALGVTYWTGIDSNFETSSAINCQIWNSGGIGDAGTLGDETGFVIGSGSCSTFYSLLCVEQ